MASRIKAHLTEIAGTAASLIGAITANQEKIEWSLRCMSWAGSALAAFATVFVIVRNEIRDRKAKKS